MFHSFFIHTSIKNNVLCRYSGGPIFDALLPILPDLWGRIGWIAYVMLTDINYLQFIHKDVQFKMTTEPPTDITVTSNRSIRISMHSSVRSTCFRFRRNTAPTSDVLYLVWSCIVSKTTNLFLQIIFWQNLGQLPSLQRSIRNTQPCLFSFTLNSCVIPGIMFLERREVVLYQ